MEESHYYPFGLVMAGISSKALAFGGPENKYKFGGKELNNKEFSDGAELETYDFGARNYDPQIGRWFVIDPLAEKMQQHSPFNYAFDNPLRFIDPDGQEPEDWVRRPDGTVVYNSRVTSQYTAQTIYGWGSVHITPGSEKATYTASLGEAISLKDNGVFTSNGKQMLSSDLADVPVAPKDNDGDGKFGLFEANHWRANANGQPVLLDAAKVDVGPIDAQHQDGKPFLQKNLGNGSNNGLVFGALDMQFDKKQNGYVILPNKYDFDVGASTGHPWVGKNHQVIRNVETILALAVSVATQGTGTDFMIHFNGVVPVNKSSK